MSINLDTVGYADLALSAYLNMHFNLMELHKIGENKFEFMFESTPELKECINSYFNNTAAVSPSDYFNAVKRLKTLIYTGGKNAV